MPLFHNGSGVPVNARVCSVCVRNVNRERERQGRMGRRECSCRLFEIWPWEGRISLPHPARSLDLSPSCMNDGSISVVHHNYDFFKLQTWPIFILSAFFAPSYGLLLLQPLFCIVFSVVSFIMKSINNRHLILPSCCCSFVKPQPDHPSSMKRYLVLNINISFQHYQSIIQL